MYMPRFLDLFAGAGGLSEGFLRAGYEAVAHVEMDAAACYTMKTRMAYHWLRKNNQLGLYTRYLNREITRDQFYEQVPKSVLASVLNYEISAETLPCLFSNRFYSSDLSGFLGLSINLRYISRHTQASVAA